MWASALADSHPALQLCCSSSECLLWMLQKWSRSSGLTLTWLLKELWLPNTLVCYSYKQLQETNNSIAALNRKQCDSTLIAGIVHLLLGISVTSTYLTEITGGRKDIFQLSFKELYPILIGNASQSSGQQECVTEILHSSGLNSGAKLLILKDPTNHNDSNLAEGSTS